MTRRVLALLALVLLVAAAAAGTASAYTGTSLNDNISPETKVHGLADHWPSNRFGLDHHDGDIINTAQGHIPGSGGLIGPKDKPGFLDWLLHKAPTGVDIDGVGANVKHTLADIIWDATRYGVDLINTLLMFALSLDLLSGHDSLLGPVADAGQRLFGEMRGGWMQAALVALGLYVLVFAVIRRAITQTFGKVAVSFLMVSFALLLLNQWQWTIGATSKYTNEASLAIIGTVNGDTNRDPRVTASDALMDTLIINPFLVLNFGGLEHCVDKDGDPVKPKSDDCTHGGTRINNRKYLKRWLDAGPANSPGRQLEYETLRDAKKPDASAIKDAGLPPNAFDGYNVTKADTPAVDIQQRELSSDRLVVAGLAAFGALGAGLLIGGLAIGIIVFKIFALVLFGITAFIAVASLFPGAGHRTFWEWAERLIVALTLNVWYSLVLSLVLLISRAMTKAGPEYGWKLTFFILAMFWWLMFLLRKRATRFILGSLPGNKGHGQNHRTWGDVARDWHYKSKMLHPAAAGVGAGAGAVLHGTEKHPDRSLAGLARNARAGAHEAKHRATQAASTGHTTRLGDQAAINAMALDELEAEHKGNIDRHSSELQNRAERKSLEARQRVATNSAIPTDVLASMQLPSSALAPAEQRKLQRLQHAAMPEEEFEALGRTIGDVERHREDTGGQPFSSEQIRERAQRILERDEVSSEDLAERARRYSTWEYRDLFAEDDPLLGPRAGEPPQRRRLRDRVPTVGGSDRGESSRPQRPSRTRRRSHRRADGD
jgi:hypothetical protein